MNLKNMARVSVVLLMVFCFITGCTTYYRVANPTTGKVYYTTDLDHEGSGVVQFIDAKTGEQVTLPSSEVREVTKEEYETGRVK